MIPSRLTFVEAERGAGSGTGAGLSAGNANSFSSLGGSEMAGVNSGSSDLFSTGEAETS